MSDPKLEEQRQSKELADLIQAVINDYGRKVKADGRMPIMNALAGALTSVQGGMLASIEDPRIRKMLRHAMERHLPKAIAESLGRTGKAEIVYLGERRH